MPAIDVLEVCAFFAYFWGTYVWVSLCVCSNVLLSRCGLSAKQSIGFVAANKSTEREIMSSNTVLGIGDVSTVQVCGIKLVFQDKSYYCRAWEVA